MADPEGQRGFVTVGLASVHDLRFLLRQTPGGDGVWAGVRVVFGGDGPDSAPPDWLVVVDAPPAGFRTRVPAARRILIVTEPPEVRTYAPGWLRRFGAVIAADPPPGFVGARVADHPCMPWFYGLSLGQEGPRPRLDWAALAAGPSGARAGLISAVCSTKRVTVHQARRLRFLGMLGAALGPELRLFGRGFAPIDDKAEGIAGFRHHLVLENNLRPGFWTEKLADAILGGAFPIVSGGGGLARWFDPLGFAEIDICAPRAAVAQVRAILAADPTSRPEVQAAMAANRRALMERWQLFPALAAHVAEAGAGPPLLKTAEPIPRPAPPAADRLARPFRSAALRLAPLTLPLLDRG